MLNVNLLLGADSHSVNNLQIYKYYVINVLSLQFRGDAIRTISFLLERRCATRRSKMSGTFKTKNTTAPTVGEKVVIFVDNANQPTGIWEGELISRGTYIGILIHGEYSWSCEAKITDSRVEKKWLDQNPHLNYIVMYPDEALIPIFARVDEYRNEINGLKKRMENERNVLYGAMKAMVSNEAMQLFLEALGFKEGGKKM